MQLSSTNAKCWRHHLSTQRLRCSPGQYLGVPPQAPPVLPPVAVASSDGLPATAMNMNRIIKRIDSTRSNVISVFS